MLGLERYTVFPYSSFSLVLLFLQLSFFSSLPRNCPARVVNAVTCSRSFFGHRCVLNQHTGLVMEAGSSAEHGTEPLPVPSTGPCPHPTTLCFSTQHPHGVNHLYGNQGCGGGRVPAGRSPEGRAAWGGGRRPGRQQGGLRTDVSCDVHCPQGSWLVAPAHHQEQCNAWAQPMTGFFMSP